ncbi:MAG TPA: hypothetical protein VMW01_13775 [Williamwhitmania sp.]|nr:hypothetical protein [Williamwhitmania sp.]
MKRVSLGVFMVLLCGLHGCYWFEETIIQVFPKDKIAKYYLNNIISAPARENEPTPKERAAEDYAQFMDNWEHNIKEVVFDVSFDSVLFKELKVEHHKLNATVILHYTKLTNLDDSSHPGFLLWKLDDEYPISHNGTVVTFNGSKYIQWPADTEKFVIKYTTASRKELRKRRVYIRLAPFYLEQHKSTSVR